MKYLLVVVLTFLAGRVSATEESLPVRQEEKIVCSGSFTNVETDKRIEAQISIPASFSSSLGPTDECSLRHAVVTVDGKSVPLEGWGSCYFTQKDGKISLLTVLQVNDGMEDVLRIEVVPERIQNSVTVDGLIFGFSPENWEYQNIYGLNNAKCELVGYPD